MAPVTQSFFYNTKEPKPPSELNPQAAIFIPFSSRPPTPLDFGMLNLSRELSISSLATVSPGPTPIELPSPYCNCQCTINNAYLPYASVINAYSPWPYCAPAQSYMPYDPLTWNPPNSASSAPAGSANLQHPVYASQCAKDPRRVYFGWPMGHPPLRNSFCNDLHPSRIPDAAFLHDQEIYTTLKIENPWEGGKFNPAVTPWWTHWMIAIAYAYAEMKPVAVCRMYKWRYRHIIPGLRAMTQNDMVDLFTYISKDVDQYAFDWEKGDEEYLKQLAWNNLTLVTAETRNDEPLREKYGVDM